MGLNLLKRYKAVAYLPNIYTLLQYLLLEPYPIKDTLFFIHKKFPVSLVPRLPESDFLNEDSQINNISWLKIYCLVLQNRNLPVFLGGSLTFTDVFLRFSKNPIYLEDGTQSYELHDKAFYERSKRRRLINRLILGDKYPKFGLADNVRKIYLTGILPIPEVIAHKVELIDLKQLWMQKTKEQQDEISAVFLPPGFDRALIREYDVLLLTQPFSEFSSGRFTEEEKIEVYRKLVSNYDESKLIIKKHPAEATDYKHYFPQSRVLDVCCPMELLFFMGLKAKTVLSVNSTALFGFDDFEEKIITGYDVTPALKKEAIARGIYDGISNRSVVINNFENSKLK